MELHDVLNAAVKEKASDVHLKAGLPPILRIYGTLAPVKNQERLTPDDVAKIAMRLMNDQRAWSWKIQDKHIPAKGRNRNSLQGYTNGYQFH